MTPGLQSKIANLLMTVGLTPWIAMMGWVAAILLFNRHGQDPRISMLEPVSMIGLIMMVYSVALVIAGVGFLWSLALVERHHQLRSTTSVTLRVIVGVTIGIPLLFSLLGSVLKWLW